MGLVWIPFYANNNANSGIEVIWVVSRMLVYCDLHVDCVNAWLMCDFCTRWLHLFVDTSTITSNHHLVKNSPTSSHGILTCEGIYLAATIFSISSTTLRLTPASLKLCTGMKVNGGFFLRALLFVNVYSPGSSIGMSQIWRFKIAPCIVTTSSCFGSHDDTSTDFSTLTFCFLLILCHFLYAFCRWVIDR